MTTALVTGAAGFLAKYLPNVLRGRGSVRIVGADLRSAAADGYDAWHAVDFGDAAATRALVAAVAPSTVFHLVGAIHGDDAALRESNVKTASNVIDAVRELSPAARIVLVGSAAEYGPVASADQPVREDHARAPSGAYGRAKCGVTDLAERAAREWAMHVAVARPFNLLGAGIPDSLVAGAFIGRLRAALAGAPPREIRVGTLASVRDFIAAEDVAEGLALIAERGRAGEAYNLCSGEAHAISELLDRLLEFAAETVQVRHDGSLVRAGEVDALIGSREKAGRELGWSPAISFDSSLRAAWDATAPAAATR
jgi:nucleoside-diphosphate-sugar epimerase